jgi:hypothetical protein
MYTMVSMSFVKSRALDASELGYHYGQSHTGPHATVRAIYGPWVYLEFPSGGGTGMNKFNGWYQFGNAQGGGGGDRSRGPGFQGHGHGFQGQGGGGRGNGSNSDSRAQILSGNRDRHELWANGNHGMSHAEFRPFHVAYQFGPNGLVFLGTDNGFAGGAYYLQRAGPQHFPTGFRGPGMGGDGRGGTSDTIWHGHGNHGK